MTGSMPPSMKSFSLNIRGRLVEFDRPAVMGIVNATPDSFYGASRVAGAEEAARRASAMAGAGAAMLDVGAYSSRPGAAEVSEAEEMARMECAVKAVRDAVGGDIVLSVDTFRASVAEKAVGEWGADIVNDISGGLLDEAMFSTVAALACPYILMHMRGTPATMQTMTEYSDVLADVIGELSRRKAQLEEFGVADIIIDSGFGFAKTAAQNYRMLAGLDAFGLLGRPVLVGVSRKSMFTRELGITAEEALPATTAANAIALERGAAILRVHDVEAAVQAVEVVSRINQQSYV